MRGLRICRCNYEIVASIHRHSVYITLLHAAIYVVAKLYRLRLLYIDQVKLEDKVNPAFSVFHIMLQSCCFAVMGLFGRSISLIPILPDFLHACYGSHLWRSSIHPSIMNWIQFDGSIQLFTSTRLIRWMFSIWKYDPTSYVFMSVQLYTRMIWAETTLSGHPSFNEFVLLQVYAERCLCKRGESTNSRIGARTPWDRR
jgi:hypothetical protein